MSQKVAVAIIHGAGSQGPDFADKMITRFITGLQNYLPENDQSVPDKVVINTVYWADILARKQRRLWNSLNDDEKGLNFSDIRRFIIDFGADAVAYQPGANRREIYNQVHQTMASALQALAEQTDPEAPLCIIAHSIGTVITHNYLFDLGEAMIADDKISESITPLEAGKTLTLLYFLGSPLALWSLRYDNYRAIEFPGKEVEKLYPQLQPSWVNFYDTDDVLAYPIRSLSPTHSQLAEKGLLYDIPVNVGGLLSSWNPLSHMEYWTDDDVIEVLAKDVFELWQAANPSNKAT